MSLATALLGISGLAVGTGAHGSANPSPESMRFGFTNTVVTNTLDDGSVVGCGPQYKMIVGGEQSLFIPVLGNKAPRNLPLKFGTPTLRVGKSVVTGTRGTPRLDDLQASVDHGAFTSVYDLAVDHVEQSFVIDELPVRGELTLRVPLTSELASRTVGEGLVFDIPGFGSIAYGGATIRDGAGRNVNSASEVVDGAIEIRVPASFVESAALPIVIDPLISPTLDVDETTSACSHPDIAYDGVHDMFLVVFERANSATEHDIFGNRVIASNGSVLSLSAVDTTQNNTKDPGVANSDLNQNFLVVWHKEPDGLFDDIQIRGALMTSGGPAGSSFEISNGSDNESHPVVGGSNAGFLVAWQENPALGGGGENISAREVSGAATMGPKLSVISNSADEVNPAINKHTLNGRWMVAYEVVNSSTDHDIRGAVYDGSSFITTQTSVAVSAAANDLLPTVAALPEGKFLVGWQRNNPDTGSGVDSDVLVRGFSAFGIGDVSTFNLSDLEFPGDNATDQTKPILAASLNRAVLAYFTTFSGIKITTFKYDSNGPVLLEKGMNLLAGISETDCAIASRGNATDFDRMLIAAEESSSAAHDITGQFLDTNTAGGATIVQTGCGGALEPILTPNPGNSKPILCEDFTITLQNFQQALLVIGLPASIPLCAGQGGCSLGATPTLIQPFANGTFTFTLPCDPTLFDFPIAMTGVSIIAPTSTSTACGPPKFAQTFRTSDTIVLDFQ